MFHSQSKIGIDKQYSKATKEIEKNIKKYKAVLFNMENIY